MPIPQFLIDRIQEINEHVQESFDIRQGFQRGINHEIQLGIQQGRMMNLATEMGYFEHNEPIQINRGDVIDFINRDDKDSIDKLLFIVLWGIYFQTTGGRTNGNRFIEFINAKIAGDNTYNLNLFDLHNIADNEIQLNNIFTNFKRGELKIPGIDVAFFSKLFYFYTNNQNKPLLILDQRISEAIYKLNSLLDEPSNLPNKKYGFGFNDYKSYLNVYYIWLDGLQEIEPNINTTKLESFIFESHRNDAIN